VTLNGQLARKRAEEVVRVPVANGVDPAQMEAMSFGVTPGGTRDNQVEVLVR
jgi:hypothetical protein